MARCRIDKVVRAGVVAAAAVMLAASGARAESAGKGGATGAAAGGAQAESGAPQAADRIEDVKFLTKAAVDSMVEVRLAEMAEEKASSDAVHDFAVVMLHDHEKSKAELTKLANERQIEIPEQLSPEGEALEERLGKLAGYEFDTAYMDEMVEQHVETIETFRRASRSGDGEVERYAKKMLPVLEKHLKLAREANQIVSSAPAEGSAVSR